MLKTKPNRSFELAVLRGGKEKKLTGTLGWRPLEVVRPEAKDPRLVQAGMASPDAIDLEKNSPMSMLATLQRCGDQHLDDEEKEAEDELNRELPGVHLRTENWQIAASDQTHAVFRQTLPEFGLEITKTYRLAKVPQDKLTESDYPAYHLQFSLAIKNIAKKTQKVAYRLDGANGLPREGWWYANKVSRNWGGAGLRDVVVLFEGGEPRQVGCPTIADGKLDPPWQDQTLTFLGVDAQYFSAVLIPKGDTGRRDLSVDALARGQRAIRSGRTSPTPRSA